VINMRRRLLLRRLTNLSILVGKYYLDHYRIHGSARILRALLGHADDGLRINTLTRSYLLITISHSVVNDLIHAVKMSLNDYIRYREFRIVYDKEVWGPIDVSRTIRTYPSGLYASLTYFPTSKSPEYVLLREMAVGALKVVRRILNDALNIKFEQGREDLMGEFRGRVESLGCAIRRLRRLVARLPRSVVKYAEDELVQEVRRLLPYSSPWFVTAYNAYLLSRYLVRTIRVAQRRFRVGRYDLVLLGWRLYEIFIYTVLLSVFIEHGYEVKRRSPRRLILVRGGDEVRVLFNSPLGSSIVRDVNGNTDIAREIRGRPDASISGSRRTVVVECKFSGNPTYITAGRFKVMAYMYEYNADLGVLVFPDLDGRFVYDEEDRATSSLWDVMARNNGIAKITLSNGRSLYMVRADPAEGDEPGEIWEGIKSRFLSVLKDEGLIT